LRGLSTKLLLDLKEARERFNQTGRNGSLPPSREAHWERSRSGEEPAEVEVEAEAEPTPDTEAQAVRETVPAGGGPAKPMVQ